VNEPRKLLIIGGGFAGLAVAKALKRAPVDITLVDRCNYHLFQPLLYQVAMAGLSPAEIAQPIRAVLSRQANARVLLGEVVSVDLAAAHADLRDGTKLQFDYIVVAAGARANYFGNDSWSEYAHGLKSIEDALEIRRRVLLAFERAERVTDVHEQERLLTFVVIGGGPTGVELAGALAELRQSVLAKDYRAIDPRSARVVLLEMADRVLTPFHEKLSKSAAKDLEDLGVEVRCGTRVTGIDREGVHLGDEVVRAGVKIWASGVRAVALVDRLGLELTARGSVPVEPDCSIPGHRNAFAIGDLAYLEDKDGRPLPGVAPVAMQQGRYVASCISADLASRERKPFRYLDKGMMATIGRSRAVLQFGRIRMTGYPAWLAWIFVHIWYLVGFRNRAVVLFEWMWSYLTYKRGARLITEREDEPLLKPKPTAQETADHKQGAP
jgi:NADH dehydrogenase